MAAQKASITTHILDQTTGLPASGVKVTLTCDKGGDVEFQANTDSDGRISNWTTSQANAEDAAGLMSATIAGSETTAWTLTFETEPYFKQQGKTSFWSKVQLPFLTHSADSRKHWHVPLLLGPFGYTTYRGS